MSPDGGMPMKAQCPVCGVTTYVRFADGTPPEEQVQCLCGLMLPLEPTKAS